MCYINPKVDFAFKKLFGSEENKDILKALVNSILPPDEQLTEITLKNPYNLADFKGDKQTVVDIKAIDERGRWYDIEIQVGVQEYFAKRSMYYWSEIYTDQIKEKGRYGDLNKVVCISLLDYSYLPEEDYHNTYRLLNVKTHQELDNICELHFVELNKFTKDLPEVKTALERWVTFLNNAVKYNKNTLPAELARDEMVKKAIEKLEVISMSDEEREIYKAREKFHIDYLSMLESAEKKARQEGMTKGMEEGIAKGIAKGIEQGKIDIACRMLAKGVKVEDIADVTGLTEEEVCRLCY